MLLAVYFFMGNIFQLMVNWRFELVVWDSLGTSKQQENPRNPNHPIYDSLNIFEISRLHSLPLAFTCFS